MYVNSKESENKKMPSMKLQGVFSPILKKKCWLENCALVSLPCNVINRDNDITNVGEEEEEDKEEAEKRLKLQQELLDKDQMIERLKMQLNQQSDYEKMKRELL